MFCRFKRPNASMRMFCFPWAGGGGVFYASWGETVTEDIEVYGTILTARENRFKEPPCANAKETIDWIVNTIHDQYWDKPFIFYGHSMGALLAFFVAMELKRLYNREPEHMFLSGTIAPHSVNRPQTITYVDKMSTEEFVALLRRLGGCPSEILDDPEMLETFIPALYADFSMIPQFQYEPKPGDEPPLSCPVDFIDGADDVDHDIDAWRLITKGPFSFRTMPGGHFWLKERVVLRRLLMFINSKFAGYEDIV